MTSNKILAVSLLSLLGSACSNSPSTSPSTASSAPKVSTSGAARVHGDVVPSRLSLIAVPAPTELTLISGSDALAPRAVYGLESIPVASPQRDFRRVMKGVDPAAFTFPLDAPYGGRVIVRALDPGVSLTTVHMHNVATGQRLDLARDAESTKGFGRSVIAENSPTTGPNWAAKMAAQPWSPNAEVPTPPFAEPFQKERFTDPLVQNVRVLAVDVPSTPGMAALDLPPDVMASGVFVEVQQPNSPVGLAAAPSELNYGFGDSAQVTMTLTNGSRTVDGARMTAWAELPDHARGPDLTFTSVGGGRYTATVPLAYLDRPHMGVWVVRATAAGTVDGVAFERSVETAWGYYPAHAQMTAVGLPVIARAADGLIDEVSVDVDVQTLRDDRFGLRGTLTFLGADGQEHALAQAQTGQVVTAGTGTITLHFTAASMALARANGPFHVRDLALVSQAWGFTEHRLGRGLDLATAAIAANEIRYPTSISLQAQDLIENGDLGSPAP